MAHGPAPRPYPEKNYQLIYHTLCALPFFKVFPATSETFVLNQIIGLLHRGHEVEIFSEFDRSRLQAVFP